MRIGVDGIILRGRDAGSLRYCEQLLAGLAQFDSHHQYIIFVDRRVLSPGLIQWSNDFFLKDVPSIRLLPSALRQQFFLSWQTPAKIDLLHCPIFPPPLWLRCKTVMTVMDLNFDLNPKTTKWTGRMWWKLLGWRGIRKADRLITLSEHTKLELTKRGIAEEKISVVHLAPRPIFVPAAPKDQRSRRERIAAKYKLPARYLLYVGTLEPRKNVANLIRAFARAKQTQAIPHRLVIAGARGWLYDDIFRTVETLGLTKEVVFLGYVPDEDLPDLYSGADLFVYLSRYEGFGLPVLEAMACGAPVLTSDSSSLPEVVGDAGVLTSPNDVDQIAREMTRILSDESLRRAMIERGLERAALFSQERFIRGTLAVYEETGRL